MPLAEEDMTTINTIEDLMRVLDDNPAWLEAMRVRLLTRELLELPDKFTQLTDTVSQQGERLDQLTETVNRIGRQLEQFIEAANRRFDDIEVEVKRHSVQMGELKGIFARSLFAAEAALVARDMGLRRRRHLDQ